MIKITELPIGKWTRNYKDFLEKMIENNIIEDFKEYHKTDSVHFEIIVNSNKLQKMFNQNTIEKIFKLNKSIPLKNFVLFDHENKIKKYDNELEILTEFFDLRLKYY